MRATLRCSRDRGEESTAARSARGTGPEAPSRRPSTVGGRAGPSRWGAARQRGRSRRRRRSGTGRQPPECSAGCAGRPAGRSRPETQERAESRRGPGAADASRGRRRLRRRAAPVPGSARSPARVVEDLAVAHGQKLQILVPDRVRPRLRVGGRCSNSIQLRSRMARIRRIPSGLDSERTGSVITGPSPPRAPARNTALPSPAARHAGRHRLPPAISPGPRAAQQRLHQRDVLGLPALRDPPRSGSPRRPGRNHERARQPVASAGRADPRPSAGHRRGCPPGAEVRTIRPPALAVPPLRDTTRSPTDSCRGPAPHRDLEPREIQPVQQKGPEHVQHVTPRVVPTAPRKEARDHQTSCRTPWINPSETRQHARPTPRPEASRSVVEAENVSAATRHEAVPIGHVPPRGTSWKRVELMSCWGKSTGRRNLPRARGPSRTGQRGGRHAVRVSCEVPYPSGRQCTNAFQLPPSIPSRCSAVLLATMPSRSDAPAFRWHVQAARWCF